MTDALLFVLTVVVVLMLTPVVIAGILSIDEKLKQIIKLLEDKNND